MFLANVSFHYLDVTAHTALLDEFPHSFSYLAAQHMVAVFRDPHKMVLDVVKRVRPCSVVRHQSAILTEDAKALRLKAKVLDPAHRNKVKREEKVGSSGLAFEGDKLSSHHCLFEVLKKRLSALH